jgi:hypothetical protein
MFVLGVRPPSQGGYPSGQGQQPPNQGAPGQYPSGGKYIILIIKYNIQKQSN